MAIKRIKLSIEEQIEKKEESIKQLKNQKIQLKKKLNEQEICLKNEKPYILITYRQFVCSFSKRYAIIG